MNQKMKIIREVNNQAELFYNDAVRLGDYAASMLTNRHRSQMTSLENIADELHDLGAPEAGHVDVVPVQLARSSAPRRGSASGRVRQSNRAA